MKIKLTELTRNFTTEMVKGTFDKLISLGKSGSLFLHKANLLQQQVRHMLEGAWDSITSVKDVDAKLARIPVEKRDNRYK